MRQSQTYRRSKESFNIDPNAYHTYRSGVAIRIYQRNKKMSLEDAWQLSAVPAFFMWLFRKPRAWVKRKKVDRKLRRKMKQTGQIAEYK